MKVGILTSVDTRHRYFARALARAVKVVAVGYEQTGYSPAAVSPTGLSPEEACVVERHFAERSRQEELFFGTDSEFLNDEAGIRVIHLAPGTLNDVETVSTFEDAGVDTVAVYGTNLLKPPLLGRWGDRMINLHLGLSPYYRGTATNFYPLLNEEPQYVGATIHVLASGIDNGPILRHARPEITAADMPHTIGCKAIQAGITAMIGVLADLENGVFNPVPQWPVPNPRLYLRKDYHPRQVVELYRKIEAGLIRDYVAAGCARTERIRLVV